MDARHEGTVTTHVRQRRVGSASERVPHLFLTLDSDRPLSPPVRYMLRDLSRVALGRGTRRRAAVERVDGTKSLRIELDDQRVSSNHARLERAMGAWLLIDQGSKNGTLVNGVRSDRRALDDGDVIAVGHTLFLFREALATPPDTPLVFEPHRQATALPELATMLPAFGEELARLARLATADVTLLIEGDTGTGKEVLAGGIHRISKRTGDLIAVNCGGLPSSLVESELFGHRKGAFTGAVDNREGYVRAASGGTLFLDEIGDLPLEAQATLLRVLQEKSVVPVGESKPVPVDARVLAATHRDLDQMVARGTFRDDLLARLAGARVRLPPLRERRCDLGLLVGRLLARLAGSSSGDVGLTPEAAYALLAHDWPHNVRELESALATALALAPGGPIDLPGLPATLTACNATALDPADARLRRQLVEALRRHRGNVSATARDLGKARQQIQRWLKRLGVRATDYR